MLSNTV